MLINKASFILLLLGGGICNTVNGQNDLYKAGFKALRIVDKSRIYRPGADTSDYLHYRPVDIDIWYPASGSQTDTTLMFKSFLDLFASRANYYTASNAGEGLADKLAQSFCEGFNCSTAKKLLGLKTDSYKNAGPAKGNFPVIIYMASFNGMGYENFRLFENLAKKGFVIISIISTGRYPGDMTTKNEDMMQQVYDAVASFKYLQDNPDFNFSKIGILGYSWSGLSGAILSTMVPNVDCLISLEGSEFHHYNKDKNEDADFDNIKDSPSFKKMTIAIPYLRLESSPIINTPGLDTVYDFTKKLSKDRLILKIDSAEHQDFCCLPVVVRESGNCRNPELYDIISNLVISFLEDHLVNKHSFSQTLSWAIDKRERQVKNE